MPLKGWCGVGGSRFLAPITAKNRRRCECLTLQEMNKLIKIYIIFFDAVDKYDTILVVAFSKFN